MSGPVRPMVQAQQVCKDFGALPVLKGVTLAVDPGQVLVVVGPSGSGKSTFLRCINHLETVSAGRLYVDGELVGYRERRGKLYEMSARDAARQRSDIGMVFQHFNLFPHRTALENISEAPVQVKKTKKVRRHRTGSGPTRAGRTVRQGGCLPGTAVRWSAAAGRDRPRAGHGAQADALRRAHLGAGSGTGGGGAGCHEKACRRGYDDDRGHPRDGLRA